MLPTSPVSRRSLLTGAAAVAAGGALALRTPSAHAADGITLLNTWRESDRDVAYRVRSTALRVDATVRVLLPTGYDANPTKRYPVLYLLHGSSSDASTWVTLGGARAATEGKDVIVVMPDGGSGGWYTNHTHVSTGRADWRTFHVDQLVPATDQTLRTIASPRARAVAGFSMGGYGAAVYGGRYPSVFSAVSTYSGATDAFDMQWREAMYNGPARDGENAGAIYGTLPGQEAQADLVANDPSTYASTFVGRRVRLYAGNDTGYEAGLRQSTDRFHTALVNAGVGDLDFTVLAGAHTWDTAGAALRDDLPGLLSYLTPARTF